MDAPSSPACTDADWSAHVADTVGRQRSRAQEFLAAQKARLAEVESQLAAQVQEIAGQIARDRDEAAHARESIERQSQESARLQEELDARRGEVESGEAQLQAGRQQLAIAQREHQAEAEHVAAMRARLEQRAAELDARAEQVAALESRARGQRQRIAQEFKARHAAHLKELDRRRAELEKLAQSDTGQLGKVEAQLQSVQQDRDRLQAELRQLGEELERARRERQPLNRQVAEQATQLAELAEELAASRRRQVELASACEDARQRQTEGEASLEAARARHAELTAELEAARGRESAAADPRELAAMRAERDAALNRLAEAERKLAAAARSDGNDSGEEFKRRYEMAMDDLRQLKAQNESLRKQLAEGKSGQGPHPAAGVSMDWEAQKRRILAALEAESDDDFEPEREEERLKIGEVIRATEDALAAKEHELDEMRQILETQSASLGSMAVGAAALGEVLDQDEIIREQRESLRRLEEEWKEKLRRAEIDISIERAKIARERAELDERARHQGAGATESAPGKPEPAKAARGRWLSRLGLGDGE